MLAKAQIPKSYQDWNRYWGAPFGKRWSRLIPRNCRTLPHLAKHCGFFAFQTNNDTRAFEYPWAFSILQSRDGRNLLEIGGGLSGFQFVLDRVGYQVVNVDPGKSARGRGWPVTVETMTRLNRSFGTKVKLKNCFVEDAMIEDESHDHVVSISTIEHLPDRDIEMVLRHVHRMLKPRGLFIVSLDLFLDVEPFASKPTNRYGKNISVKWLVEQSGLTLVHGNPAELYGFPEFNPIKVQQNRDRYLVGKGYPAMVQTIVLQK